MQKESGSPAAIPLAPEVLVPRLGEFLVETGSLTHQQLERALRFQEEQAAQGTPVRLGKALRTLKMIDEETLDKAITVQILQLQSALEQANRELERRVCERTNELRKALDRLTQLNQEKANFVANISHELRTPLTLLKGYLEIITEEGLEGLPDSSKGVFQTMINAEATLEKLIDDLIAFSYAERGRLDLEILPTDMADLVGKCIKDISVKAQMANVGVSFRVAKKLPLAACDAQKITWVIDEMLTNAIKFSSAGANVRVSVQHQSGLLSVVVQDEGIGIPEDRIYEIFEPFHQLESSTVRRFGGTGLGLALAQRILEAHGCSMQVESTLGKGSSFRFSLPVFSTDADKGENSGRRV